MDSSATKDSRNVLCHSPAAFLHYQRERESLNRHQNIYFARDRWPKLSCSLPASAQVAGDGLGLKLGNNATVGVYRACKPVCSNPLSLQTLFGKEVTVLLQHFTTMLVKY